MSVGAVNKQTGERIPTAGMPAVDSVLSGTSTNPVQNKVVKAELDAKQNTLTAGDYVVIENDKISVSKLKQGKLDLYSYEFVTTDASHTPKVKVIKKVNGETISETVYDEFQAASWMTFDNIIRFRYDASDSYKWKYQCLVTSNEHVKDTVISWFWNQTVDYTETFDVGSSAITDLVTKGDMNEALAGKQDALTFDDTPTDGSNNPVKSNGIYDALATKANTDMVAADFNAGTSYSTGNYCVQDGKLYKFKNNHSGAWSAADVDEVKITGELASLKSGLIGANYILNDSVKGGDYITRLRGNVTKISNVVTITGVWKGSATNTTIITLIPEGFRPSGSGAANAVLGSGTIDNGGTLSYAEYTILSNGQLRQAQVVGAVSGGTFTFCYAI